MAFTGERKINVSPIKNPALAPLGMGVLQAGLGYMGYSMGKSARDAESIAARNEVDRARRAYMDIEYVNPYTGTKNWYADMQNVYEDATINQQQAQFMRQQQLGTGATTMEGLRGAAGSSGVGGLALAFGRSQGLQAQEAAASIGAQESQLMRARLAQQAQLNKLERGGAAAMENRMVQGSIWQQGKQESRARELFAMGMQRDMAAQSAQQQAQNLLMGGIGAGFESLMAGYGPSGDYSLFAKNPNQI
tara:strand:+ start:10049 stop:10792 length:744 start_codon:yes stop_codon:yes gene_type:complete